MQQANSNDPIPNVTAELEQRLDAARKEKTLAQVPALRRLRNVVRVFFVLGIIWLPVVIAIGVVLHTIYNVIAQLRLGVSSYLAFGLYSAGIWVGMALSFLVLCIYFRFLKQIRVNHVHQIQNTTAIILPVFRYQLLLAVLGSFVFPVGMFQNSEAAVGAGRVALPNMIVMIVMYFIVRHYVLTAEAELPSLAASAGDDAPRGNYRTWKSLFVTLLVIALPVLAIGFIIGGTASSLFQVRIPPADLPSCISPEVAKLLEQVIRSTPGGATLKSIDGHRELSHDPATHVRHGECVAHTEAGDIQVKFVVEWQDRGKGLFQVRIVASQD